MNLNQLYQEIILEHQHEPRNFKPLKAPQLSAMGFNPICGDKVKIEVNLDGKESISEVGFQGEGCAICMASSSMMCEAVENESKTKVLGLLEDFRGLFLGTTKESRFKDSDLQALAGVKAFPVRIKCALLPWMALKEALSSNSTVEVKTE